MSNRFYIKVVWWMQIFHHHGIQNIGWNLISFVNSKWIMVIKLLITCLYDSWCIYFYGSSISCNIAVKFTFQIYLTLYTKVIAKLNACSCQPWQQELQWSVYNNWQCVFNITVEEWSSLLGRIVLLQPEWEFLNLNSLITVMPKHLNLV